MRLQVRNRLQISQNAIQIFLIQSVRLALRNEQSHLSDCLRPEQRVSRQVQLKAIVDPRNHLEGGELVPAQVKEIVMNPNLGEVQGFGPDVS